MFPAGLAHVRVRWVTMRNGVKLRVAESGAPTDPPVLLIHGWGASLYMWRAWFAPLAAAGRRVIAVDLPGHGLSDKPEEASAYRLESLVALVRELLDAEGLPAADIIAQSMAGTIALELALEGEPRLRRLVLVNPACFGRVRLQRFAQLASPPTMDAVLPRLVGRWIVARAHRMVYGDPSRITPRDEDEYWAPSQFPAYARAMRRLLHEFRWTRPPAAPTAERLRALRSTALVVLGTKDRLIRQASPYVAELSAAGAPLEVKVVEGGGHAVNEERADEMIAMVLDFLRR